MAISYAPRHNAGPGGRFTVCSTGTTHSLDVLAIANAEPSVPLPESVRLMPAQAGNTAYIGVRCADQWCVVGTKFSNWDEKHPNKRAHGWYDYQTLGDPSGSTPKPSNVKAYVTAVLGLEGVSATQLKKRHYQVATVEIGPGNLPAKYYNKGFREGKNMVMLMLTSDTKGEAYVMNDTFPNGNGTTMNVTRTPFPITPSGQFDTPAVARWGWYPMDEDIWVRCDLGCCMVEV